ncbi:MAG: flavin reductase [Planctomycetaceae bacterium]|nr:flavin reductase [Planctomycetaceae bacterium]MCB9950459.1 flavin reductase [Planctomycetaceae bacterium]
MNDDIAAVLGRTPSGLFIVTLSDGNGHETGLLASWVQQASFEPPAVTVAVNKKRYANEWLKASPKMALNLIGETQKQFLGHFGKGFEPDANAFDGLATSRTPGNLTALNDALGWLEGEVKGSVEAGDHTIHLVELTAAGKGTELETQRPWVHVRKSGAGY